VPLLSWRWSNHFQWFGNTRCLRSPTASRGMRRTIACGYCAVFKDRGGAARRPIGSLAASSRIHRAGAGLSKLNSMLPVVRTGQTRLGRHARPGSEESHPWNRLGMRRARMRVRPGHR